MKLLIIGSGGREHALAWKLKQSPRVTALFCAPGNAGTAELAENVPIAALNSAELLRFVQEKNIDLTIVGPDDPLAAGIVDVFQKAGLKIFGPTAAGARLESSKSFAKEFMQRHGIPTASSATFTIAAAAYEHLKSASFPLVIKADGLALGKGVVIAQNHDEAAEAIKQSMELKVFGEAGSTIIIEEFLLGSECSLHALIDGKNYTLFPDARDHKRAYDGDQGLNTGGMGTISPSGIITADQEATLHHEILKPFLRGMAEEGLFFQGLLFPGIMMTEEGPKVIEFNCRFGDPETQVFVRRLKSDLLDLLEATVNGSLASQESLWDDRIAVCVVLASGGYPGPIEKGKVIEGLSAASAEPDVVIFHAGTKFENNSFLTNGGRVLGITALGATLEEARAKAYRAADMITFEGKELRRDIGA